MQYPYKIYKIFGRNALWGRTKIYYNLVKSTFTPPVQELYSEKYKKRIYIFEYYSTRDKKEVRISCFKRKHGYYEIYAKDNYKELVFERLK